MKRKYGDHKGWARIAESLYTVARVERPAFRGVVSLYSMLRVHEPLYKPVAGELTLIGDNGFHWLQLFSNERQSQTYTVTAMFDAQQILTQWYIDVCAGHGVDHMGVPWHDDLYLDLIVSVNGAVEVIDTDDLEEAAEVGVVAQSVYDLAWREAHRLAPLARSASLPEMRFAREALAALLALEHGRSVTGYTRILPPDPSLRPGRGADSAPIGATRDLLLRDEGVEENVSARGSGSGNYRGHEVVR